MDLPTTGLRSPGANRHHFGAAGFSLRGDSGPPLSCDGPRSVSYVTLTLTIFVLLVVQSLAEAGDQDVQRVVTIAPNAAEIICELGACDRVVGVSKFCVYPPELKERERVGGLFDPNIEKIVILRPDLVVLRGHSESVERVCDSLDIPIYFDETDTMSGIAKCVRDLGKRLGKGDEAERLVERFQSRLDAVRKRVGERRRPRVLITVSRMHGKLANILTSTSGTFLDEMVEIAGGENAFAHLDMTYPQVSPESIVARRPEVIIELMPGADPSAEMLEQLRSEWGALSSVPAVANDRIYFITDDHALIPSPRFTHIVDKLARLLHPEVAGER
jgi:iron complex transport system substrate-binding protein